jgi:natural product precursor
MEPKKIKKLVLNKETIAQLNQHSMSDLKGGCGCANSTTCGNSNTETLNTGCVDIYSIGHDDGSICLSQTGFLCGGWCYGI